MAVSKVFDGVSDLIMGRIIDKTKSKYGKARPWYARMIIPTSICAVVILDAGGIKRHDAICICIHYIQSGINRLLYRKCRCTFIHDRIYDNEYEIKRYGRCDEYGI